MSVLAIDTIQAGFATIKKALPVS